MGIYAVTGGASGIGARTAEILRAKGHDVINIDIARGDINADLGTPEGRAFVIEKMHELCPDGLDGFVCNHGIAGLSRFKPSYILSVNYFSAVVLLEGLFDLLQKKHGRCSVTSSGSIVYAKPNDEKFYVDELLTNCGDEARIGRLVDSFINDAEDESSGSFVPAAVANTMYLSSKIALAQHVRRISSTWAARGVTINAVAPGAAATAIMQGLNKPAPEVFFYPMPALADQNDEMDAADIANLIAFLVLPGSKGMSGSLIYCDAGASAIIDPNKY